MDRTVNASVYILERKDRLVEDVRILRVVIGTAFEGRLDRMNDRVDDYRRLLEKRRADEEQAKKSGGRATFGARRSDRAPTFSNHDRKPLVDAIDDEEAGRTKARRHSRRSDGR